MDLQIHIEHYPKDNSLAGAFRSAYAHTINEVISEIATIEAIVQPFDAWDKRSIEALLSQEMNQLLVAIQGGKVIGCCLYQVLFEQAEIFRIATHPDYHRLGVASKILDELLARLKASAVTSILLEVRADNVPAIGLYHRYGFELIHNRENYYRHPHQPAVDALIMQCTLLD